jgi:hypothetical protein
MNQDAVFFAIAGLVVLALMIIGPGFVVWQYQRGGIAEVHDKPTKRSRLTERQSDST